MNFGTFEINKIKYFLALYRTVKSQRWGNFTWILLYEGVLTSVVHQWSRDTLLYIQSLSLVIFAQFSGAL